MLTKSIECSPQSLIRLTWQLFDEKRSKSAGYIVSCESNWVGNLNYTAAHAVARPIDVFFRVSPFVMIDRITKGVVIDEELVVLARLGEILADVRCSCSIQN